MLKMTVFVLLVGCLVNFTACTNMGSKTVGSLEQEGSNLISLDVKKEVLDNGLTILVVENKKLPVFSYYTYFKVGSKFESPGTTGSSHLLEHMMFKGAKKYGEGKFDQVVEGNGGVNNAYTTNDLTVYYESLPSEHFETIVDVEADRMQNLLLAKESFEKERNVVLEERRMRYENSDRGKIYLDMMKTVFQGTPYGSSVIGEVEDLKTVSREKVQEYFKTYYAPNNAVIVVVGSLDADKVIKSIKGKFEGIPPSKNLEEIKTKHLSKLGYNFSSKIPKEKKIKGTAPTPMFALAFKGLKIGQKEAFILDVLASIIGEGESSYLNKQFVTNRKPRLQNIYAANYTLQDSGVFFIGGQLLEKVRFKKFKNQLFKKVKKSCDESVSQRALQKVVNQYLVGMMKELDTNAGIARFIGDHEVYYGSYDFYKKEIEIYSSITEEEVKSVCKKYLNPEQATLISLWNKN